MESVVQIEALRTLRAGISQQFRGCVPDENGEPVGELVDMELVVPPLNFQSLQSLGPKLATLNVEPSAGSMGTLVLAIEQALRRNYRGVPRWLIEQTIDPANMADFVQSLMDVSGMRRKELEAGKAKAAEAQTGTTSTAT